MATGLRDPLNVFPDAGAASRALGDAFVAAASVQKKFHIALSGGATPRRLYRHLADASVLWERVHVFWADERYVRPDDPASNVGMLRRDLLDLVAIPEANVHPPRTDIGDPDEAARLYENDIRALLGNEARFDWILLGLGEDGHTASLFPAAPATLESERLVVAVHDSPKPPPVRLTMTPPLLNRAREIHMLVTGEAKRAALTRVVEGEALGWLRAPTLWVDREAWM